MIRLARRPAAPAALSSKAIATARSEAAARRRRGERLTTKDLPNHWNKVKKALHIYQNGKCCFCEVRRRPDGETDVEHFRPKLGVEGHPRHPGYWWLAYEWTNYLLSCKACNSGHKQNHFPLLNERARASSPTDRLSREHPVLIDPSLEDPANFIEFDWVSIPTSVVLRGKDSDGRGAETIRILGLAIRDDLLRERYAELQMLRFIEKTFRSVPRRHPLYREALERLQSKLLPDQPHLGLIQAYVRSRGLEAYL